jgi:GntR family transcriptional regulator, transcriptional repressor for pyruvate dehydrogenase complex
VGTYSPGERLPPERELAERLSVSRVTIRQALQQVGELGLVEARRGRGGGTFVTALSWRDVAPEQARALDRRLHGLVCTAAGNRHLVALSAHLTTAATLGFGAEPYEPDFFVQALVEHEELIAAVVDGDGERAQRVAQAHFALTYLTMERSLERAVQG